MPVEVRLYQNYSDPYIVHKKISLIKTVQCEITEANEIDSPTLLLDMENNPKQFNYCYIPEYGRYYFCSPRIENGAHMRLECSSDVLMSFWDSFSSSQCIAERSSSAGDSRLEDNMLPFISQPEYIPRQIQTGFNPSSSGGCYILTVGGK